MANEIMGYPQQRKLGEPYLPKRVQAIQNLARWKQAGGWLEWEIGTGMQKLVALAIPGHPSAEMLEITASIWCDTLPDNLIEEIDRERIQKAFAKLVKECREWPQVADLIKALPPRPERVKLPEPELSEAEREKGRERMREVMERFK